MIYYQSLLLDRISEYKRINSIFFEGQIYDAYSLLIDILNKATKEIVIIDNYINKELLDVLKSINKRITIITKQIDKISIKKYNEQYDNIDIKISNSFHDRFIILDRDTLYHCGASLKI